MTNLLDQAASWLADQLRTHASTQVVYSRGAEQVAARAQPAGRIQNPAAQEDLIEPLDETVDPDDAPLPTETVRRPVEYRAPSRY